MSAGALLWRCGAHPEALSSLMVRARLPHAAIGEVCELRSDALSGRSLARGIVVAIQDGVASVCLLDGGADLSPDIVVMPTGARQSVAVSPALLGAVLDGCGRCVDRLSQAGDAVEHSQRTVDARPVDYRDRLEVDEILATGVRAVDGLLTSGHGQRMGVFAMAGAGKTTFVEILLENADADVFVVAMIGERGREVASFVERLRAGPNAHRTIMVQATSDTSPGTRCNAALLATTVAEYFRDRGGRVLLVMDSVTRYARALREVALAAGEPPARRGYPASVFEALPRLVERPGATRKGSITAFYTVLLEEEDDGDPVGEEVKSLLDGHIYLSARLAARGHYPAIDVLRSKSRLFEQLASPEQASCAERLRAVLGTLEDMQLMRDLGEYKAGANAQYDDAIRIESGVHAFLRQRRGECSDLRETRRMLDALVS